jgi:uncharacterized repeat protein (TIGR01451 family)
VAGGAVEVILSQLNLDGMEMAVSFDEAAGHYFEMSECRLTHNADNNNADLLDLDDVMAPSTLLVRNNFLASTGQPISHGTGGTIGDVEITLQGNIITTTDPANSHQGIQIRVGGDENLTLNIFDNVIFGVGGCNCGGPAGIEASSSGTSTVVLNINNNTIDAVANGVGMDIEGAGDSSSLIVNVFNNTVSNTDEEGMVVSPGAGLTINNGFNNFFNNGEPNAGFTEGVGTLAVDPLFIDPADANYHLRPNSPLINAGTNSPDGGLPDVDADGRSRIIGGTVDIGAYEASADLELIKTASADNVNVGEELIYTLTVTNLGPDDTDGVILTDTLPAGLTLNSAEVSQGSCVETNPVVCDLASLQNGESATVTIRVTPDQSGSPTNTATVTSGIPDPDPDNNTASVTTQVAGNGGGGCGLSALGVGSAKSAWTLGLLPLLLFVMTGMVRIVRIGHPDGGK